MLFQFENINTLQTLLLGGFIPQEVIQSSCKFGYEGETILVHTDLKIESKIRDRLRSLGVKFSRKSSLLTNQSLNWIEILPVSKTSDPDVFGTIIIKMERSQMTSFVQDFVGQGHLSQMYAFYDDKVLCRVVDPPYYLVLKYMVREDIQIFHEIPNTGVWIQSGYSHPLLSFFRPDKNILLIPAQGEWIHLPSLEWKEVFEYTNFTIGNESFLQKEEGISKINIPLSLIRGTSSKPEILWVIRDNSMEQIEMFLKNIPDDEVDKYSYSVFREEGSTDPVIVLKARNTIHPPTLNLNVESYISSSVPWIFLPKDCYLSPPLRPGILQDLFFHENSIVWLYPTSMEGRRVSFQVEHLEDNFLPLTQWVQYVISENEKTLQQWVKSSIFSFEEFIDIGCEWKSKPKKKPKEVSIIEDDDPPSDGGGGVSPPIMSSIPISNSVEIEISLPNLEPSEQEIQFNKITEEFYKLPISWEDPQRVPKWVEIGNFYASFSNEYQAVLCWSRALWISKNPTSLISSWFDFMKSNYNFRESEVELFLKRENPSFLEIVFVCLWVLQTQEPSRLEEIQSFLQIHQKALDQRLLWEVKKKISILSGGDHLLLASTYDQILNDNSSISIRELPGFIRSQDTSKSLNFIQDTLETYLQTYLQTDRDISPSEKSVIHPFGWTRNFLVDSQVRMLFALAFARTGQRNRAQEELEAAKSVLMNLPDSATKEQKEIESLFFNALSEKVEEALNGESLKDFSSPFLMEIQNLPKTHKYLWGHITSALSFLPNKFGSPFGMWHIVDSNLGLEIYEVQFGKETEREIDRILEWSLPKLKDIKAISSKGLFSYLIYLCNSIEVKLIPQYLKKILDTANKSVTKVSQFMGPIIKLCTRFDLKDLLTYSLSLSFEERTNKDFPKYIGDLLCLGVTLHSPFFENELKLWNQYFIEKSNEIFELGLTEGNEKEIQEFEISLLPVRLGLSFLSYLSSKNEQELLTSLKYAFSLMKQDLIAEKIPPIYKVFQEICNSSSAEIVSFITMNLLQRLPKTSDKLSINKVSSISVLSLLDKVLFGLISDSLILSEEITNWASEDEKILFKRIQEDLRS